MATNRARTIRNNGARNGNRRAKVVEASVLKQNAMYATRTTSQSKLARGSTWKVADRDRCFATNTRDRDQNLDSKRLRSRRSPGFDVFHLHFHASGAEFDRHASDRYVSVEQSCNRAQRESYRGWLHGERSSRASRARNERLTNRTAEHTTRFHNCINLIRFARAGDPASRRLVSWPYSAFGFSVVARNRRPTSPLRRVSLISTRSRALPDKRCTGISRQRFRV
ncbi:uncharacterized protein LOC143187235 [Calliopsis andreniformis]|uniref:uncharacterized protein LOC143187235 n=1 Tax=Calliopsis andreniformis TaxID=337506 RepID=UPI003FCD6FD7